MKVGAVAELSNDLQRCKRFAGDLEPNRPRGVACIRKRYTLPCSSLASVVHWMKAPHVAGQGYPQALG